MVIDKLGNPINDAPGAKVVTIANDVAISELYEQSTDADIVELTFPKFVDGRAYSQARRLRLSGFSGDIRATGDVLLDQVFLMKRCGFSSFVLRKSEQTSNIHYALKPFERSYQVCSDERTPIWRAPTK